MDKANTVFILDDDVEICKGLRWLFESVNLQVETYQCASKFLSDCKPSWQGCFILDVRMPIMSGIEVMEILQKKNISLPTVVMSGYGDISMAIRSIKLGAIDFIIKPINEQQLLDIIHSNLHAPTKNHSTPYTDTKNILTKREQQVLDLIMEGKLNKQIADILKLSISTIEVHRAKIMRKFSAKNLVELVKNYFFISP